MELCNYYGHLDEVKLSTTTTSYCYVGVCAMPCWGAIAGTHACAYESARAILVSSMGWLLAPTPSINTITIPNHDAQVDGHMPIVHRARTHWVRPTPSTASTSRCLVLTDMGIKILVVEHAKLDNTTAGGWPGPAVSIRAFKKLLQF